MKYIAHRGYSKHETENTIASAELAGQKDYFYGIEYDIHLTKDNKFVVHHDYTTVRLGNIELDLKSSTYNELLENVKLVNINTKEFEHKIPLLDEYIDICNKYDKVNIIEIKPNFNEEEIKMFYEAIKKANKKVVI